MKPTLFVHCGDYNAEDQTCALVFGQTTETPEQLIELGLEVASNLKYDFVAFTNNDYILYGIRLAVARKQISPSQVTVVCFSKGKEIMTKIRENGDFETVPPCFKLTAK